MNDQDKSESSELPFPTLLSDQELLEALERLGFTKSTPVQALSLPPAIEGKDLVIEAKTGSGKTLAFGLPMLSALQKAHKERPVDYTFGLVIAPTRELALQLSRVLTDLVADVEPVLLIGGMSYPKQRGQLERDRRIVIGTPGRMLDFIERGGVSLSDVKMFVLDEADEMFSMGFIQDVERILREIPPGAQGLFVSATISPRVHDLAKRYLNDAQHIEASTHDEKLPQIEHLYCNVQGGVADKPTALCDLLEHFHPHSAIIFCNTKSDTELVEKYMRRRGFDARRINSDLNQSQRNRIMEKVHASDIRFLIATDIAARGIDIAQIELVVNFSLHGQPESYLHRTGRTGRAGRKGMALSLVGPQDFMPFRGLRELPIELQEIQLPSEEELAGARLTHLTEALRDATKTLRPRDLALAKQIIKEYGDLDSVSPDLENFIAVLSQFSVEHLVKEEAVSLEEELRAEQPPQSAEKRRGSGSDRSGKGRGRGRQGGQGRNRGKRNR